MRLRPGNPGIQAGDPVTLDHGSSARGRFSRVDLHLHSVASGPATNWWVKQLGPNATANESYTSPGDAHALAREAGMDFVTITDHETIAGGLTLTARPDFLLGEEINARFPEDGSTVDVLIYGFNPDDHRELQARRGNVYHLVAYLKERGLFYALAHPMFQLDLPLTRTMIEKRLVLFSAWELINGARPANQNRLAAEIAERVDALDLRQLAARHGLQAPDHRTITGVAGSDDHGGAHIGSTWTNVPRVESVAELLIALRVGACWPGGEHGSPEKMVHTGIRLAALAREQQPNRAASASLLDNLPLLAILSPAGLRTAIARRYETQLRDVLHDADGSLALTSLLGQVGKLVETHLLLSPFLAVHGYFSGEQRKTARLQALLHPGAERAIRVGVFVDDVNSVHGVSTFYRNLSRLDGRSHGVELHLVPFDATGEGNGPRPVASLPLPFVADRALDVPSLLDVVELIAAREFDLVHVASPGPLGIAALVAARVLGLPVVGGYHTELGEYARVLTDDNAVGVMIDLAVRAFYERCDAIVTPSHFTREQLARRGYPAARLSVLRNGVDTTLFHPGQRDETWRHAIGGGRALIVYAGRMSGEKGLDGLADTYLTLRAKRDDVHLVLIGDGPARTGLETRLAEQATFTGFLRGDALARAIASGDLFVFPSQTDTLGRAVTEAQACGAPAIVFDRGGQVECMTPGETGIAVAAGDFSAFSAAIERLLDDPTRRAEMSARAAARASDLQWDKVLAELSELYRQLLAAPAVHLLTMEAPSHEFAAIG